MMMILMVVMGTTRKYVYMCDGYYTRRYVWCVLQEKYLYVCLCRCVHVDVCGSVMIVCEL